VRVLLAARAPVEDHDGERGGAVVVAEDEQVAVAQVVGAGELLPPAAEVHVAALFVGEDLHVPQGHHLPTGKPQLQLPASSELPGELSGQPLRAGRSD